MEYIDIVTTDREEFFASEMKWYRKRSLDRFKKYMEDMESTCESCGVYYWKYCEKRCNCNLINNIK
jgi:hypothetical protein